MTKLLVSVRNLAEAKLAIAAGVDIIDMKEPQRGSLGAVDQQTLSQIIQLANRQVPLSAALGELADDCPIRNTAGLTYAKYGLSQCHLLKDWKKELAAAIENLSPEVKPIAVIYADWKTAAAPPPAEVLSTASELSCAGVLIDTFDKQGGALTERWSLTEIECWIQQTHDAEMFCALAGSLTDDSIAALLPLEPDVLAVRTLVCRNSRTSQVDPDKLAKVLKIIHQKQHASS